MLEKEKKVNQIIICPECQISIGVINKYAPNDLGTRIILSSQCNHDVLKSKVFSEFFTSNKKCANNDNKKGEYFCFESNRYFCKRCYEKIIKEDSKNFYYHSESFQNKECNKHSLPLNSFCIECRVKLCEQCHEEHKEHLLCFTLSDFYYYSLKLPKVKNLLDSKREQIKQIDNIILNLVSAKNLITQEISKLSQILESRETGKDRLLIKKLNQTRTSGEPVNNIIIDLNNWLTLNNNNQRFIRKLIPLEYSKFAAGGGDNTITLWDGNYIKYLGMFTHENNVKTFISIKNIKAIASIDGDNLIKLWSIEKLCQIGKVMKYNSTLIELYELEIYEMPLIASSSEDRKLCIWDLSNFNNKTVAQFDSIVNAVFAFPETPYFYSLNPKSDDMKNVCIWSYKNFSKIKDFKADIQGKIIQFDNKKIVSFNKKNQICLFNEHLKGTYDVIIGYEFKIVEIAKISEQNAIIAVCTEKGRIDMIDCSNKGIVWSYFRKNSFAKYMIELVEGGLAIANQEDTIEIVDYFQRKIVSSSNSKIQGGIKSIIQLQNGKIVVALKNFNIMVSELC